MDGYVGKYNKLIYCWKAGTVGEREVWLKSPETENIEGVAFVAWPQLIDDVTCSTGD